MVQQAGVHRLVQFDFTPLYEAHHSPGGSGLRQRPTSYCGIRGGRLGGRDIGKPVALHPNEATFRMSATARPGTLYSWIALETDLSGDSMDVRKGWPYAAPARHEVAPAAHQSAIGHLDVYTTARSTVLLHPRTNSCVSTIIETPLCNPAMTLFRCSGRHTYGSSPEAPGGGGTHSASPWHDSSA
jgi:hypothetical protein